MQEHVHTLVLLTLIIYTHF